MSSRSTSGRLRGRLAAAVALAGLAVFTSGLVVAAASATPSVDPVAALSPLSVLSAPFHICLTLTGRLP
jgi:hypothetical protein